MLIRKLHLLSGALLEFFSALPSSRFLLRHRQPLRRMDLVSGNGAGSSNPLTAWVLQLDRSQRQSLLYGLLLHSKSILHVRYSRLDDLWMFAPSTNQWTLSRH